MCMERAVSGQGAARSRIVEPDSGGGDARPHRRDGLTSHHGPTSGRQPLAEYPPVVSSLDETRGTIDRFSLGCNDFSAMNQEKLSDVRCPRCNKLLGRGKEKFGVIVMCKDEADHKAVYERLKAEGYKCRVVRV